MVRFWFAKTLCLKKIFFDGFHAQLILRFFSLMEAGTLGGTRFVPNRKPSHRFFVVENRFYFRTQKKKDRGGNSSLVRSLLQTQEKELRGNLNAYPQVPHRDMMQANEVRGITKALKQF